MADANTFQKIEDQLRSSHSDYSLLHSLAHNLVSVVRRCNINENSKVRASLDNLCEVLSKEFDIVSDALTHATEVNENYRKNNK